MSMTWRRKSLGQPGLYDQLGVKRLINARGDPTVLGGSTVGPSVQAAMEEGNEYFVDMPELMHRSGEEIARIIGCEAAMVTSGCFAALVLGTAAIMAGNDPDKIAQLPDSTGMKSEFLIMKGMRYHYDKYAQVAGGKLVEVGNPEATTAEQMEAAIGPNTAGIVYLSKMENSPGMLSIPEVINIARKKDVAVIVDAAAEVYPLDRMRWLSKSGADAVCFATKYVGSNHSTGIITGPKEKVETAFLHSFVAYESENNHNIGRGYKVNRQDVLGTIVALQEWFSLNFEDRFAFQEETIGFIERGLSDIPGLKIDRTELNGSLRLRLTCDEKLLGKNAVQISQALAEGDPSIVVANRDNVRETPPDPKQFSIAVHHLRPEEPVILIDRIREVLGR